MSDKLDKYDIEDLEDEDEEDFDYDEAYIEYMKKYSMYGNDDDFKIVISLDDICDELKNRTDFNKIQLKNVMKSLIDIFVENLRDGNVIRIYGFGQFEKKAGKVGSYMNFYTGERFKRKSKGSIKFSPTSSFRNRVYRRPRS